VLWWNCGLKHFVERMVEVKTERTGRQGRRSEQLLDDFKERIRYCIALSGELTWDEAMDLSQAEYVMSE